MLMYTLKITNPVGNQIKISLLETISEHNENIWKSNIFLNMKMFDMSYFVLLY